MVREDILQRFGPLAFRLKRTNYLFGDTFGVADRYPFILTGGAQELGFPLSACYAIRGFFLATMRHQP